MEQQAQLAKTIDTLVEDIQALFSGKELLDVANFSKALSSKVVLRFAEHLKEREPYLRLSAIGKPIRQQWYDLKGFKGKPLGPEVKMKFLFGDILEELLLFLAKEAGHTVERTQEKVELDDVPGSIDAIIDGVLVDTKSASTFSWKKFKEGRLKEDDPFGYRFQLSSYSKALGGFDGAFLVIDKTLGKLCLDRYSKEELTALDPSARIKEVREALKSDVPPERCYEDEEDGKSGNRKLGTGCSYCSHVLECWKDANGGEGVKTYLYSTGPRYLTVVKREPKVNTWETFSIKEEAANEAA